MNIPQSLIDFLCSEHARASTGLNTYLKQSCGWSGEIDWVDLPEKLHSFKEQLLHLAQCQKDNSLGLYVGQKKPDYIANGWLNASQLVPISQNGDKEFICLDFSFSHDTPKVYASDHSGPIGRWKLIANNVNSFLELLA